jgi:LPS sulfotransferase NodH
MSSKNILILAEPRTGSGLLCRIISTNTNTVNTAEFFGSGYRHISQHLNRLSEYVDQKYILGINDYRDMLHKLSISTLPNQINKFVDVNSLKLFLQFKKQNICLKIFNSHFFQQNIDTEELLDMFDAVVLLYRYNLLDAFISLQKGLATNVWCSLDDNFDKNKIHKIQWDIEEYNRYYKRQTNVYSKHLTLFYKVNKPKCILAYEDMSSARNKYLYIQNLLFDNHIHHTIPIKDKDPIEKQSISNMSIADNFINPTDFLQDYKHIQHKLYNTVLE